MFHPMPGCQLGAYHPHHEAIEQPSRRAGPFRPRVRGPGRYTPRMLRAYDFAVIRFSNSFVWRCPARWILQHYDRHVRASHLDVGPGTGYYLDRCHFPSAAPSVTLVDPNPEVVRFAADRIAATSQRSMPPMRSSPSISSPPRRVLPGRVILRRP
jgi:hypothetical protein